MVAGVALALHFATWIASLSYTSVAASVLLVNTAPLFTLAFSRVFLRESAAARVLRAIALALVGRRPHRGRRLDGRSWLAGRDRLALAGAVTLAVYHVIGRGLREALPLTPTSWASGARPRPRSRSWRPSGRSPLFRLPAAHAGLVPGPGAGARRWPATASSTASLRVLPAPTVGLFLLGEPVAAPPAGLALFGEMPGAADAGRRRS